MGQSLFLQCRVELRCVVDTMEPDEDKVVDDDDNNNGIGRYEKV